MERDLVPVEQKEVEFYGDELTAVRASDGHIYVSVRHLCDALGLAQRAQVLRIQRSEILSEGYQGGIILITPGGRQPMGVLRVDLVPLWLTGISTKAVKDEIRPKLERFQREAAKVLWEAFQEGRLTAEPTIDDLLATDSPAAQAYRMAEAIMRMARQQLLLEARLDARLDQHEDRLERIEAQLGDRGRHITPEQAAQISQAVKAVAMALGKKSSRNEYGGVYGELYRRYSIPGYRELPADKFDDAMQWLNEWLQSLIADSPF